MTNVTDYLTIDGEVVAETRGGVDRDYLPDPLGSTAELLTSSQAETDAFAYCPTARKGRPPDRRQRRSASSGLWGTGRTRQAASTCGRGTTGQDSPGGRPSIHSARVEAADQYAGGDPTTWTDPSGTQPGGRRGIQTPHQLPPQLADLIGLDPPRHPRCRITGCNKESNRCVINYCFNGRYSTRNADCIRAASYYYELCALNGRKPFPFPRIDFDGSGWMPRAGIGVIPPPYGPASNCPAAPLPGTGKNMFDPSLNFWLFGYGYCCGGARACGENYPTVDCLDQACRKHDVSVPTVWEYLHRAPHIQLAKDVAACDCAKDWRPSTLEYKNCKEAQKQMAAYAASQALSMPFPIEP